MKLLFLLASAFAALSITAPTNPSLLAVTNPPAHSLHLPTRSDFPINTTQTGSTGLVIGYILFYISVNEYCEGPLMRASSLLVMGSFSDKIFYDAGDVGMAISLGYPNKYLRIGPYKYASSVLPFKYGGGVWSQDELRDCGGCSTTAWNQPEKLDYERDAAGGRMHDQQCYVRVEQW